jgi:hypothetical protein
MVIYLYEAKTARPNFVGQKKCDIPTSGLRDSRQWKPGI